MSVPGLRTLTVAFLGVGAVFGGMHVSLTAFTQEIGRPGLAGRSTARSPQATCWPVSCRAPCSRAGGGGRLLVADAALTLACAPLWAAPRGARAGRAGPGGGLCIAPALITGYTLVDALVPAGSLTEAFTWLAGSASFGQAVAVTTCRIHGAAHRTALALMVLAGLRGRLVPHSRGVVTAGVIGHRPPVTVD